MKVLAAFVFCILSNISSFSQSGWVNMLITTDPTSYTSIHFINENTGWAVGWVPGFAVGCRIAKSTNGGINWNCQLSNPYPVLFDVQFLDNNTGWAVGWYVMKTTNSGIDWSTVYTPAGGLSSLSAVNHNTVYIVGSRTISGNQTRGTITKTTNSGNTFDTVSILGTTSLNDVIFLNEQTGWIVGNNNNNGVVVKTTNGGITWNTTDYAYNLYSVYFNNENTGWIGGSGIVLKTTNGGDNWANQLNNHSIRVLSIQFIDENNGWFCGDSIAGGKIYHTVNSGTVWTQQIVEAGNMPKLFFINQNTGWAVGIGGNKRTTNGGNPLGLVHISSTTPSKYLLFQNYPNPFNPVTRFRFELPKESSVILKVYNSLGEEIQTLINQKINKGTYEYIWNVNEFPSGIYFYELIADDFRESKKMILIK